MFDKPPEEDADDMRAWFLYFRMTKYLPGMSMKFETEMQRADTGQRARMVLTSYAAAALDVIFYCGFRPGQDLAQELQDTFKLKPAQLMLLSVDELVKPLKVTKEKLVERLTEGGFVISGDGVITSFNLPAAASPPRSLQGRRGPGI